MGILSAFSLLDRFRRPILFYSKENQQQSTSTGIVLSLTIYSFLLYYLLTSELVRRQNPKVIDQTIDTNPRPEINLKRVVFSVENAESVSIVDPTLFSVVVNLWHDEIDESKKNGFKIVYTLEEELRPCNEDDFEPGVFAQRGYQNKYCFKNKSISIKGYFDESKIDYFCVSLRRCINSTENNNTCQSDDAIDEYFTEDMYFSTYFLNPFVDMRDYNQPVKSTWKTLFSMIDPNAYKEYSVYMKKVEFTDDDNLPFVSEVKHELYNFDKVETDIRLQNRAKDLVSYFFYSSNLITNKLRKYQGLSDVIAEMGGLLGVFMLIGMLITEPEFQLNTVKSFFGERVLFKKNDELIEEKKLMNSDQSPKKDPLSTGRNGNVINSFEAEAESIPSDPDFKNDNDHFEKVAREITKNTVTNLKEQHIKEIITINIKHEKQPAACGATETDNVKGKNHFNKQISVAHTENKTSYFDRKIKNKNNVKNKISLYNPNKFHGESSPEFEFSLLNYVKLKFKESFNLILNKNESVFRDLESKFRDDLNVGHLLQRIFIIENKLNSLLFDDHTSLKESSFIRKAPNKPSNLKRRKFSVYDFLEN